MKNFWKSSISTEKMWFCWKVFVDFHTFIRSNIRWMIKRNLFKFLLSRYFHKKKVCSVWSNISWDCKVWLCDKRKISISFLPRINNAATIGGFFITYRIYNHIKHSQCFTLFIWIGIINILISFSDIVQIFLKKL